MKHSTERGIIMSKKGWGKFVAFAAVSGAVAAGISYALQYKTFHKELEKDFREFEDDDESDKDSEQDSRKTNRKYISLSSSKDELKLAARDMAEATKNVLKDASAVFSDTAHEAVSAAVDTAHIAMNSLKAKKDGFMEGREENDSESADSSESSEKKPETEFLDDDYVDEDELFDYARIDDTGDFPDEEPVDLSILEDLVSKTDDEAEEADTPVYSGRDAADNNDNITITTAMIEDDL